MGSKLDEIIKKEILPKGSFPSWLQKSVQYEAITGSVAYGINQDTSDMDVYGFCIPSKNIVFPHLQGKIHGYDKIENFEQWQKHHVIDKSANGGKGQEYDFTIYSIIKYFALCRDQNPNMVDSLFVPSDCVLHCTPVAGMVRSKRRMFLSKRSYHKFRGYMHSQIAKLDRKPEGLQELLQLEEELEVDRNTTLDDVKLEIEKRGLLSDEDKK